MAAENKKQFIRIRGANENNLKNLSVDIPRDKFVVLTGSPLTAIPDLQWVLLRKFMIIFDSCTPEWVFHTVLNAGG